MYLVRCACVCVCAFVCICIYILCVWVWVGGVYMGVGRGVVVGGCAVTLHHLVSAKAML